MSGNTRSKVDAIDRIKVLVNSELKDCEYHELQDIIKIMTGYDKLFEVKFDCDYSTIIKPFDAEFHTELKNLLRRYAENKLVAYERKANLIVKELKLAVNDLPDEVA